MSDIAVCIPCLDEESTIAKVVSDFRAALPGAVVYVYDNGSADRTAELAREAGAVVRDEPVRGKGTVIRRIFREVDARCIILADGDDTYPAESAPEMARLVLAEDVDMVVADRLSTTYDQENSRAFHGFGNRLVRSSVGAIFGDAPSDIMTGYRALSRRFVKSFPVLTTGFEIETEMTMHALDKRLHIRTVPIAYRDRPEGSISKLDTFSDGRRVLALVNRLFRVYRPFTYFSLVALVLAIVAGVFVAPVLVDYLHTGLVERLPTLIVCCFAFLAAIQSLFAGLVLQNLRRKELADFEMRLIDLEKRD